MNVAAFLTYIIITAITPGPNNIMSMTHASRMGFKKSYPFNLGIFLGTTMVMVLTTLFSSLFFNYIPKAEPVMLVIGAGYLLYLAYKIMTSGKEIRTGAMTEARFIPGVLLQFINPKLYIYSITAMGSYILPHYRETGTLLLFAFFLAVVGFSCTVLWALFGSLFRKLFSDQGRLINTIMALLLVYSAVSLFL
jgi:cysteine/O-acetylserine efflux protein